MIDAPSAASRKTLKLVVAAVVIAIVAGAIGALVITNWAHTKASLGPTRVAAAPDGGWWAISHHHLHRFTESGERVLKVDLDALSVDDPTAGLGVLDNGSILLSQAKKDPRVQVCDEQASSCRPLVIRDGTEEVKLRSVALLQGLDNGRFALSDDKGRRLLWADTQGRLLGQREIARERTDIYEVPFQPRLAADGDLLLPDRQALKILQFPTTALDASPQEVDTTALEAGRQRTLPVDVARTSDGRWWVLNARSCMCDCDLIERDALGQPVRRVPLGDLTDPRALALVGETRLLLTDLTNARIASYDTADGTLSDAGDEAFRAELATVRELAKSGNPHYPLILGVLLGAPLLGALALFALGEKVAIKLPAMQPIRPLEPEPLTGTRWVGLRPQYQRSLRLLSLVLLLAFAAVAAALLLSTGLPAMDRPLDARQLLLLAPWVVVIACVMLLGKRTRQALNMRIGTDGTQLFYENGVRSVSVPLAEVVTNGVLLLAGTHLVVLQDQRQAHFDADEVGRVILARLPPTAFVTTPQLWKTLFTRQPVRWALVGAAIVLLLALNVIRVLVK